MELLAVIAALVGLYIVCGYVGEWLADETLRWVRMRKHAVTEYPPPTGEPDTTIPPPVD
jgi:hypothetical protein